VYKHFSFHLLRVYDWLLPFSYSYGVTFRWIEDHLPFRPPVDHDGEIVLVSLTIIRRNLGRCPTNIKRQAYLSLVRPHLEYASSVWDPHLQIHIYQIEMVQRRAARFLKHKYSRDPGIVTGHLPKFRRMNPKDLCEDIANVSIP
jgi:hypothetical protein